MDDDRWLSGAPFQGGSVSTAVSHTPYLAEGGRVCEWGGGGVTSAPAGWLLGFSSVVAVHAPS